MKENKLLNIVFYEGEYYLYEPCNQDANKYNIIDNHLWLITKFMPEVNLTKFIIFQLEISITV